MGLREEVSIGGDGDRERQSFEQYNDRRKVEREKTGATDLTDLHLVADCTAERVSNDRSTVEDRHTDRV